MREGLDCARRPGGVATGGLSSFAALSAALALLSLLAGLLCCPWTTCNACCDAACAKRVRARRPFPCCCCKAKANDRGFPCCCCTKKEEADDQPAGRRLDGGGFDDGAPADAESCWYKKGTHCCFRLFTVLPLALMVASLVLGNAHGNAQFVPAIQAVIASPRGFASIDSWAFF